MTPKKRKDVEEDDKVLDYSQIEVTVTKDGVEIHGISNDVMEGVKAAMKKWGERLLIIIDDYGLHFVLTNKLDGYLDAIGELEEENGEEVSHSDRTKFDNMYR